MMPGLWVTSYLAFLGFGAVYPWYLLVKMLVIFGAHSELRWDTFLYRHRWLHPVAWVVERTISTPATHFAHHAITQDDGVGHYKGNFGNLLFFWDVLFGTAKITRRYPARVGLQDDVDHGAERWWVQLMYPLLKSRREASVLAATQSASGND
jgi:sterol desaturase/sphingolipid hydroxylase (fatty acid hydroxylase superfamily)